VQRVRHVDRVIHAVRIEALIRILRMSSASSSHLNRLPPHLERLIMEGGWVLKAIRRYAVLKGNLGIIEIGSRKAVKKGASLNVVAEVCANIRALIARGLVGDGVAIAQLRRPGEPRGRTMLV
jgi:hypothetical protein